MIFHETADQKSPRRLRAKYSLCTACGHAKVFRPPGARVARGDDAYYKTFLYQNDEANRCARTRGLHQQSETAGTLVCGVGYSKTGILGISFQAGAV